MRGLSTLGSVSFSLAAVREKESSSENGEMENQHKISHVASLHNLGRAHKNICERQRMKSL